MPLRVRVRGWKVSFGACLLFAVQKLTGDVIISSLWYAAASTCSFVSSMLCFCCVSVMFTQIERCHTPLYHIASQHLMTPMNFVENSSQLFSAAAFCRTKIGDYGRIHCYAAFCTHTMQQCHRQNPLMLICCAKGVSLFE